MGAEQSFDKFEIKPAGEINSANCQNINTASDDRELRGLQLPRLLVENEVVSVLENKLPKDLSDVLSVDIVNVLSKISKNDYRIRAFVKTVHGQQKKLILLGETHSKSILVAQLGSELVECFKYRALEGADMEKYWFARILLLETRICDFVLKKIGNKNYQAGSTLDLARAHETIQQQNKKIINFSLESSHKPSFAEQLEILKTPAVTLGILSSFTFLLPEVPIISPLVKSLMTIEIIAVVALTAALIRIAVTKKIFSYDEMFIFLAENLPLSKNRSVTFAREANQIFTENPEVDDLLTIMGRGHVRMVSNLLQRSYGWKELNVPGQIEGDVF